MKKPNFNDPKYIGGLGGKLKMKYANDLEEWGDELLEVLKRIRNMKASDAYTARKSQAIAEEAVKKAEGK